MPEIDAETADAVPAGSLLAAEFAELIGKPFGTVYDWIRAGKVFAHVVKRGERQERYFVPPAEVDRVRALIDGGLPVVAAELAPVEP